MSNRIVQRDQSAQRIFLTKKGLSRKIISEELEDRISTLMQDPDVTNLRGVFLYVLNGKEKHLNIRQFDERMRRSAFEQQKGVCPDCTHTFKIEDMEADHIKPWHEGGKTGASNCQMLCIEGNRIKGGNEMSSL